LSGIDESRRTHQESRPRAIHVPGPSVRFLERARFEQTRKPYTDTIHRLERHCWRRSGLNLATARGPWKPRHSVFWFGIYRFHSDFVAIFQNVRYSDAYLSKFLLYPHVCVTPIASAGVPGVLRYQQPPLQKSHELTSHLNLTNSMRHVASCWWLFCKRAL